MRYAILILTALATAGVCRAGDDWPAFRGGPDLGIAEETPLPAGLSAEDTRNITGKSAHTRTIATRT